LSYAPLGGVGMLPVGETGGDFFILHE